MKKLALSAIPLLAALLTSCAPSGPSYRVYISNEGSGDLTVIDPQKMEAVTTVPIGKRARGIHASADGKLIYIALSGSPFAPPGVDESTLPPPDKSADGIGVFDIEQNKMLRKVTGGSDPEQFAVGKEGLLYVSNEDAAGLSFVDPVKGDVLATVPTGAEPEGVTLTPDGKFVYVTSEDKGTITVVDTATKQAVKTIPVGRRPRGIAFLPMDRAPSSPMRTTPTSASSIPPNSKSYRPFQSAPASSPWAWPCHATARSSTSPPAAARR